MQHFFPLQLGMKEYCSLHVKRQLKLIDAGKEVVNMKNLASSGAVVNCFRKAGVFNETQTASIEDMDDPFKLLLEDLEELKLRGFAEENVDMNDYFDVHFGVSVTVSSCLIDIKILATLCNVEERDDAEDVGLT